MWDRIKAGGFWLKTSVDWQWHGEKAEGWVDNMHRLQNEGVDENEACECSILSSCENVTAAHIKESATPVPNY